MLTLVLAAVLGQGPLTTPVPAHDPLIARLGADDWVEREQASAALLRGGWANAARLRLGMRHRDPEIRARARRCYSKIRDDHLATFEPFPFIDSLYYNPETPQYNLNCALAATTHKYLVASRHITVQDFGNYRYATRLLVRDLLDEDRPELGIRLLLAYMHVLDTHWLAYTNNSGSAAVFAWQRWLVRWAATPDPCDPLPRMPGIP